MMDNRQPLIDLINYYNNLTLALGDLVLGEPEASSEESMEVSLVVTASSQNTKFIGSVTIDYIRADIAEHFAEAGFDEILLYRNYQEDPETGLRETYGLNLEVRDVLGIQSTDEDSVLIQMANTSYIFKGSLPVRFVDRPVETLADAFPTVNLISLARAVN